MPDVLSIYITLNLFHLAKWIIKLIYLVSVQHYIQAIERFETAIYNVIMNKLTLDYRSPSEVEIHFLLNLRCEKKMILLIASIYLVSKIIMV